MAAKKEDYQLVIVESPAKAKTIEKFLGNGYVVRSSYGHIRDLKKTTGAVDVEHNFEPEYIIPEDKTAVVEDLRKLTKKAAAVWLASDEDREGEAISWHLATVLGLDVNTTKRIVFHEITKPAIVAAIKTPRVIDMNLVNAQQARRVLDRLVGFELSPVLWRKVKPNLSAGRVQSVAVRLLVEREREIIHFDPKEWFSTTATFGLVDDKGKKHSLQAELNIKLPDIDKAKKMIELCSKTSFKVDRIEKHSLTRQPAPPFTTSTLQQEASRKLGMSVQQTMKTAQTLYEAGYITYMRTDSVNLSQTALEAAEKVICANMGQQYHKRRQYKTNTKGAQEAHEAIRPTYIENETITGNALEQRLYKLIWNRAVASQMADAQIERTTIGIDTPDEKAKFTASADVIKFDGFMKLYLEGTDDDDEESKAQLPSLKEGEALSLDAISSREKWTQHPPRYNEASLVKKLEEMGIGRPSTYAPTISTIQDREYVIKDSREGETRKYRLVTLEKGKVVEQEKTEKYGAEKSKLFPTDMGMIVTDFLQEHFEKIMSYDFTANVESEFDEIAVGKSQWQNVIKTFYKPFHHTVEDVLENSERSSGERLLGVDPKTGLNVYVRIGRFGPMAQRGESSEDGSSKPQYASLRKDQHIETISLEEALKLFELPRQLGEYEGKDVSIGVGRFGPYVKHDGKFTSLKKTDDPYTVSLERAIELIEEKREADRNKVIKTFEEDANLQVLNGRFGPYIAYGKANVKIPKNADASALTYEDCMKLCKDQGADPTKKMARATTRRKSTQKAE